MKGNIDTVQFGNLNGNHYTGMERNGNQNAYYCRPLHCTVVEASNCAMNCIMHTLVRVYSVFKVRDVCDWRMLCMIY